MKRIAALALVSAVAGIANAQTVWTTKPSALAWRTEEPNAARIGVYLGTNDQRDTLGVLIGSVMDESPAAKAGIKEGDRIQSIDGVNLKMARADADDAMLHGMMNRRLTRELDKKKAGDEVEFRVYAAGNTRTVRVKTVAARELAQATVRTTHPAGARFFNEDRAALGVNLGGRATKRDTLGVLIVSVSPDGPAEKAGVVEGDRIASINGMDLRVPSEDAGDAELSQARMRRLNNELGKLKAGDVATLSIVTAGRAREVKVTAVKASEIEGEGFQMFFGGDGHFMTMPKISVPQFRMLPKGSPRVLEFPSTFDGSGFRFRQGDEDGIKGEVREQVKRALEQARQATQRARDAVERARENSEVIRYRTVTPSRITIRS